MIASTHEQTDPARHEISLGFDDTVPEVQASVGSDLFRPQYAKVVWSGLNIDKPTYLHIGLGSAVARKHRFFEMNLTDLDASDDTDHSFEHAPEWVIDLVVLRPGVSTLIRDFYDAKGWKQP